MNLKYKFKKLKIKLHDRSYSVSYVRDYFTYVIKKDEAVSNDSSIRIN